jgi:hypothetical protein
MLGLPLKKTVVQSPFSKGKIAPGGWLVVVMTSY